MNKKLILGFDLDDIIIDLINPWLHWYNARFQDFVTIDDIRSYEIEKYTPKSTDIFEFFNDPKRYAACSVIKGASEGLKELHDAGHDIIITTAAVHGTEDIKWHLVKKAAPSWFKHRNLMIGSRKELLELNVFVDGSAKNIATYSSTWTNAHILTIAYPHNESIKGIVNCYAKNHHNTEVAWATIVDYIHKVSKQ